ncbi:Mitochondrial copper homeostasis protein [Gnomoniopsis smithogilvyi]|uniref:Mitochondrial copper homeostasis protein n=1 Tax=Gnomoniopsis smithogilvyi TaxID=1191159 RepID=A0A9W8YXI9_9PEZI|nr:Mitochondrial copper homeostasis protein [Gnomoniopsis smithogilvyi]
MAAPVDKVEEPWNKETKEKFKGKSKSKWLDPCQEAASMSIKCLNRNGGDRAMCQEYFSAYRECKKEWITKRQAEGGYFSQ